MDYDNDETRQWDWQRENRDSQKDSNYASVSLWNGEVAQNEEDLSYMLDDEATPVKACGDLAYNVGHNDGFNKVSPDCKESFSQMKRRRMLQFSNDDMDSTLCCDELPSSFLNSNERVDSVEEALIAGWVTGFEENSSASMYESLEDPSAEWIRDCFNDTEMDFSPDTANPSSSSDLLIDVTEFCEIQPEHENKPQQPIYTPRKIIFKGKKSFIGTPTKLPSSVAYPFAFIKPSGAHGDVTLKDINQKIRTPPPKPNPKSEDPNNSYPTSAFSGKPVVGKTKIRTEGGKGSITIMRTKG